MPADHTAPCRADAVAACLALGLEGPPRSLNRSALHRVFRARQGDAPVLLRLFRADAARLRQAEFEVALLHHLRRTTTLRVPQPIGLTRLRDDVHAAAFTWVAGRRAGRVPRDGHARALGAFLAALHEAGGPFTDRSPAPWTLDRVFEPLCAQLDWFLPPEREVLRAAHARLRERLAELRTAPAVYGVVHSDLHFANCVFDDGQIGAFDFAECGAGPLLLDLAVPIVELTWTMPGHPQLITALLDGYRAVRPVDLAFLPDAVALRAAEAATWHFTESLPEDREQEDARARQLAATVIAMLSTYLDAGQRAAERVVAR